MKMIIPLVEHIIFPHRRLEHARVDLDFKCFLYNEVPKTPTLLHNETTLVQLNLIYQSGNLCLSIEVST